MYFYNPSSAMKKETSEEELTETIPVDYSSENGGGVAG